MAADWIKMRSDIYRDPKVSVIAESLMSQDGELARYVNQMCQRDMTVTRNVMRNVTVGALVSIWGVMRQRGKRCDDDLFCDGVTVAVLDDIADLPGIGAAMQSAGWVVEDAEGIRFPNFFEGYNVDPAEKSASSNAERQRRYRERKAAEKSPSEGEEPRNAGDVTRYVTVTPREEKRREETSSLRSEVETRASRLPADWVAPDEWLDWAKDARPDLNATSVASQFRDYWVAKAGKDGRKLDWFATWRNWVRNQRQAPQQARASPAAGRLDRQLETAALLTGSRRPQPKPIEAIDAESRIVPAIPA